MSRHAPAHAKALLSLALMVSAALAHADGVFVIQVRTDLVPGTDFDEIWVDATRVETGRTRRYVHTADPTRSYTPGVRVAEFNVNHDFTERLLDTAHGDYRMVVGTRLGGTAVVERPVHTEIHDEVLVITVLLTRYFEPVQPVLERSLSIDLNGDGEAGPGDTVKSTVHFTATHDMGDFTSFREDLDPSLQLDRSSIYFTHGEISGNPKGDANEVSVRLGKLLEGEQAVVEYEAVVSPVIRGQGNLHVDGPLQYDVLTDDPSTPQLGDANVIPLRCGEPGGPQCCGDLDVCSGNLQDAQMKLAALSSENEDLRKQLESLLEDPDADGVPAVRDDCPQTAAGAAVDAAGCSVDQFCRSVRTDSRRWVLACWGADWRADEPGRAPHDCRVKRRARLCVAR